MGNYRNYKVASVTESHELREHNGYKDILYSVATRFPDYGNVSPW